jgi:hypothetical protein
VLYLKHGGHILDDEAPGAEREVRRSGHVALTSGTVANGRPAPVGTPFDYLFEELKRRPGSRLPDDPANVVPHLDALGNAMVEPRPTSGGAPATGSDSTIPAIYTYLGQFVDHDLTANTDRDTSTSDIKDARQPPVPPEQVTQRLENLRRPALDLDSLYGDGPSFVDPYSADGALYEENSPRFRLGTNHEDGIQGDRIPPAGDLRRDLPRIGPLLDAGLITEGDLPKDLRTDPNLRTRAFIGDLRNDENLIVAQLHLAFLRFHNRVVDVLEDEPRRFGLPRGVRDPKVLFRRARDLTRWHYQWLVVHDYLKTVTLSGVPDKVLLRGPEHYRPLRAGRLFMPLEFSVAAFRFGHSMVRGGYDHNRNFPRIGFDLLFQFTGNGYARDPADPTRSSPSPFPNPPGVTPRNAPTLPFNWIIEWDRFARKEDPDPAHFARKIDTQIAPPITQMLNEGTGPDIQDAAGRPIRELLRHLARRNLRRGYQLSIPTGQAVAGALGVQPLSATELTQGNADAVNAALEQGGFLERTPLWYYVLKEAEVRANGNSLGEVGSRIVCETIIGLLAFGGRSYLNQRRWDPMDGVTLDDGDPIVTFRDILTFAGLPT